MKDRKKLLIIINGKGGVGKDTLCDFAAKHYPVRNVSSITPIKEIAAANGWQGEKTPKARKFLADLKELFTQYNDLPTRYLLEQYQEFLAGEERIMFAHIREGGEIDKLKKQVPGDCITLLVKRTGDGPESWGNASDDDVENYHYDYQYDNSRPLDEAEADFMEFLEKILEERQRMQPERPETNRESGKQGSCHGF
ncbi:MAG: hypothetical protein Q4F29_08300 [Lachnospiraceae bacterium]|nr:hypothetical protein [Lachnospiraceae bacterium]